MARRPAFLPHSKKPLQIGSEPCPTRKPQENPQPRVSPGDFFLLHKFSTANTDSHLIKTSTVFTSLVIFLRLDFTGPSLVRRVFTELLKVFLEAKLPTALVLRVVSSTLRRLEVPFCLFCISGQHHVEPRLFRGLPHWVCSQLGLLDYKLPVF